ncbi:hypothetical protein NC651_000593 [Populus alba x Populus x berolinensis]|nr:hypothetical protein NC651_000593 [Populus alba x Populus x berolinensis]
MPEKLERGKSIGSFSGTYPFSSEKLQSLRRRKSTASPRAFSLTFQKVRMELLLGWFARYPSLVLYHYCPFFSVDSHGVVNHNQGKVPFGAKSLTIRGCNDVVIDLAALEFRAKLGDDD